MDHRQQLGVGDTRLSVRGIAGMDISLFMLGALTGVAEWILRRKAE
jgi:hypothetical protein